VRDHPRLHMSGARFFPSADAALRRENALAMRFDPPSGMGPGSARQ
jgi:hypothetical protein